MVDEDTKEKIKAFASGALPGLLGFAFHRALSSGTSEAQIDRELAEKYGEIAEEMRKEKRKSKKAVEEGAKPGVSPARAYRKELESRGDACGLCLEILKRLEDKPPEMQATGVPQIAEAEGAARSGASKDELKEIMSRSDVLKGVLMEMKGGGS